MRCLLRDYRPTCAIIAQTLFFWNCTLSNPPIAKADFIEGMAKGMAVLESFDTERQRLNATQAADRAGLTRAAARRHLLTLAHLGYLDTDGSHYWLSPKVLRFSGSYLASASLPRLLQPTLNRLAAQTRELPWRALVADRADARAPASADLHALRVRHFFGSACARGQET